MAKPQVLMIEDDIFYSEQYQEGLSDEFSIAVAPGIMEGLQFLSKNNVDMLLLDIDLKGNAAAGLEALPKIKKRFPHLPVIMVTNNREIPAFRQSQDDGANEYFIKSKNLDPLRKLIKDLVLPPVNLRPKPGQPIAVDRATRKTLKLAKKMANMADSILILGESGVGKDVIARYIYDHSDQYQKTYVAVNCAALAHGLISSELFGYVKGAFTHAIKDHPGKFEAADGGTIFLDEIGELKPEDQARLLRVVQTKTVTRLGSHQEKSLDFRILAATNIDINKATADATFREDLYFRLAQGVIEIPPLREREADIIPMARYFLKMKADSLGKTEKTFSHKALITLKNYAWPGNVRELQNVMQQAFIQADGKEISPRHFRLRPQALTMPGPLREAQNEFKRSQVKQALAASKGQIEVAAEALGISRQQLYNLMKDLGIALDDTDLG